MRVLVTGGAGFIGANLAAWLLASGEAMRVVVLDALTYAGDRRSLAACEADPRFRFVQGDVAEAQDVESAIQGVDVVLHLAAESHVDRSLSGGAAFVRTNVLGTQVILEAARRQPKSPRVVLVSTDEVHGALGPDDPRFTEAHPLLPTSPYAASKAAAELMAMAMHRSFGQEVVITRCGNNYGPFQDPEKLIPLMILKAQRGEALPVYGDGQQVRDWIHVEDHVRGIWAAAKRGRAGEAYLFGGAGGEQANLAVVKAILRATKRPADLIRHVEDRPGHDRRYAIDPSKALAELDWAPQVPFGDGLAQTVAWYGANEAWWGPKLARGLDPARAAANERAHQGAQG